ncbi:hypothetical protein [Bradyrhizobium sp. Leo121]|uniref:hypothetical protein n=1 Tax=Bradyrhizobium sp. Leo121 TaxID=1571195 RepID=UPI001A9192FB|nr:hypothetical protein [Bradyrhizobium sp. Leo121]
MSNRLKLKVRTKLPAALIGRTGIAVAKDGLAYNLDLDYSRLSQASQFDPANSLFAIWNKFTGEWNTISPASFSSGSFQSITGASDTIDDGTSLAAIQRTSPTATALTLPLLANQAGKALVIVDWSSAVTDHTITITPSGSGTTIMQQANWTIHSSADQLAAVILYPSIELNGWAIAPLSDASGSGLITVATRTALKALDTTKDTIAYLDEAGRQGLFVWQAGDYSGQITNDPNEGVYIKATAVAATSGAWVRDGAWQADGVDPRWFGAKFDWNGTTGTDDSAAIQAWVNFLTFSGAPGQAPGLKCRLNAPVNINGILTIRGNPLKSEFRVTHNGKGLNITSQCTLDGFRVIGDLDAAKTAQYLIHIEGPTNLVHLKNISLDGGYRNLNVNGTVFYLYLHRITWYNAVDIHFNAVGDSSAGFDVIMSDCEQITPNGSTCRYGMLWDKLGSAIVTNFRSSPANCTSDCLRVISLATLFGDARFSQCVFEGGKRNQIRLEGSIGTGNAIRSFFFESCYAVGASASDPAVYLGFVKDMDFAGGQYGGSQAAFQVVSEARSVVITNCVSKAAGKFIDAAAGTTIDTFDVTSCNYRDGTAAFLDFSAATTALNVTITGGNPGTVSNPVLMPSGQQANCRVLGNLAGKNLYHRTGVFTYGGGGSSFAIPHGLATTPAFFTVRNSSYLGEFPITGTSPPSTIPIYIREVTANSSVLNVQLNGGIAAGSYNFVWEARV